MMADLPPLPKTFIGSAILQFLAGAVAIQAGTLSLIWDCVLGYIGTGIWVGSVVVITAVIGILTMVYYRDRAWVISYLSLSALCSLLAVILVTVEMLALNAELSCEEYICDQPMHFLNCQLMHKFNIVAGAVEIFAAFGSVVLCINSLIGYGVANPYKKMSKEINI